MAYYRYRQQTFHGGNYSKKDEITACAETTGATIKGSYLVLNNHYQFNILDSKTGTVSKELEAAILPCLW